MLENLRRSLEAAPIVKMGDYNYFVHPVTDGIPFMEAAVMKEIIDRIQNVGDFDCDYIVAPEAMGIPLAVPLTLRTGIPYNVVRKRRYGLPGEVSVHQVTGYSEKELYINGLRSGDRVVIVDDVISTGGTMRALVQALQNMGVRIVDIIVVVEKGDRKEALEAELHIKIKTLVKVEVRDGKLAVLN
ncbi:MAG TPA: hypoxanthine/guanine phosphoribosyltransferase [Methanomassiliicoccales archaeon]|jgi:adenine phosphoribosyltransferase